jgi:hypothetical protein
MTTLRSPRPRTSGSCPSAGVSAGVTRLDQGVSSKPRPRTPAGTPIGASPSAGVTLRSESEEP